MFTVFGKNELAKEATVNSDGKGFKSFTLAHTLRSEKEVDQTILELREKGVEIIKEPQKVNWGGYNCYVSDLVGNLWKITFNPFLKLDKNGTINKTGANQIHGSACGSYTTYPLEAQYKPSRSRIWQFGL